MQNAASNISKAVLELRLFRELLLSFPRFASLTNRHSFQTKLTVPQALYFDDIAAVKLLPLESLRVSRISYFSCFSNRFEKKKKKTSCFRLWPTPGSSLVSRNGAKWPFFIVLCRINEASNHPYFYKRS